MSGEQTNTMTEADVESLADKLAAFGAMLPSGEQAVLRRLVSGAVRAAEAGSEVQGYFTLIENSALLTSQFLRPALFNIAGMGDGSVKPTGAAVNLPAIQRG
ncbi:MAG: hypothetical protein ACYDCQ_13940 [Dehalococcoidia bacterium]